MNTVSPSCSVSLHQTYSAIKTLPIRQLRYLSAPDFGVEYTIATNGCGTQRLYVALETFYKDQYHG